MIARDEALEIVAGSRPGSGKSNGLLTALALARRPGLAVDANALARLHEQWVAWRAEVRIARGVHRRTARAIATQEWAEFADNVGTWLNRGRRVAAIKELRLWVRTDGVSLDLRTARDWVDAYRSVANVRTFYLDPQGAEQYLARPWLDDRDDLAPDGSVRLGDVPDGAVVRFPDSSTGEVIVSRSASLFRGRIGELTTRDVETGERAFRYSVDEDVPVWVLAPPPREPRPAALDAI
jgi:hypothetical protein